VNNQTLLDLLTLALPYVEDCAENTDYKPAAVQALAARIRPASACLERAPPPRLRRVTPGRRNYGKLSGNRRLQDRSSHMPPPAPLGTGDAQAEAAQSTNSCSRRHGKYLFCFAAIVQVLLNLLGLHSMLTMVPRKTNNNSCSSGSSRSSSCSGS